MKMKKMLAIGLVIVGLLVTTQAWAGGVNLAGGLTFAGEAVNYSVNASLPLIEKPSISADLLWAPQPGEVALGVSAPVGEALRPLAKVCGFEWAPWAQTAMDRVAVGLAAWRTQDDFPVRGGLYFKVMALDWNF
jgi:hypothetical protein